MKRFWKDAVAAPIERGWQILLDGRPVRTPARALLLLPGEKLARAIAAEWAAVGETIDPRAQPLTGLANAAIDRVAPDPEAFAASLARYAQSDLLCYRADGPETLVAWQAEHWDPLLTWARRRFDIDFKVTTGIIPVDQPPATIEQLGHAVAVLDAYRLAALFPLVTVSGSLVTALALLEGAIGTEAAWAAVSLDDRWQLERWGSDAEAEAALAARAADFFAGARFLALVDEA